MLGEFYSRGYHASVRYTTEEEKFQFPNADLAREESLPVRLAKKRFYIHQIAFLLFPGNFIDVSGLIIGKGGTYSQAPTRDRADDKSFFPTQLLSTLANVSQDHAIYSNHMEVVKHALGVYRKRNLCGCEICKKHQKNHDRFNFRNFKGVVKNLENAGIFVPIDDESDFCLTPEGNYVFFEIDYLDPKRVAKFVSNKKTVPKETAHSVTKLLARIEELKRITITPASHP